MLQIIAGNSIYEWQVGQPLPKHNAPLGGKYPFSNVTHIKVTGDELAYVETRFANIPFITGDEPTQVAWGAPWAQFIYENLV